MSPRNECLPQHAAVEAHNMSVVQPAHMSAPDADPFIVGEPCDILLLEECYDEQVERSRGTWSTREMQHFQD